MASPALAAPSCYQDVPRLSELESVTSNAGEGPINVTVNTWLNLTAEQRQSLSPAARVVNVVDAETCRVDPSHSGESVYADFYVMPFSQLYKQYADALEAGDTDKIKLLYNRVKMPPKKMTDFVQLYKKAPPVDWSVAEQLLKLFEAEKKIMAPGLRHQKIDADSLKSADYVLLNSYIAMGGELINDCRPVKPEYGHLLWYYTYQERPVESLRHQPLATKEGGRYIKSCLEK
jgi:hypothetical protein